MELRRISGNTFCLDVGMALIGVYFLNQKDIVLIDTGTVKNEELFELLLNEGLNVRAVICTHLHVDHIANNERLMEIFQCPIYAADSELPDVAYCGITLCYSINTFQNNQTLKIDDAEFRTVHTPGHTEGHHMIITPDHVCCVGDVVVTKKRLETAKMPYYRDVAQSLLSMEVLREQKCNDYLFAHMGVVLPDDLSSTIDANIQKELELYDILRRTVTRPMKSEELEIELMKATGVRNPKLMQQRFMRTSAKARIIELLNVGELVLEGEWIHVAD